MPAIETFDLRQLAVLWEATGSFDDNGDPTLNEPEDIRVRFVTRRRQSVNDQGNTIALDATVILPRRIRLGSLVWEAPDSTGLSGTALEQWYGDGGSNTNPVELFEVISESGGPDIKNRNHRQEYSVRRYREKPSS